MPIYDVENRFSYYESYSDNISFGPSKPSLGSSTWVRKKIGSVVSGSLEYQSEIVFSKCLFELQNPFFRSGEVRYLRLSSAKQIIQDSQVPDPVGIYTTGSYGTGSIVLSSNLLILGNALTYIMLFSRDGTSITGSNHQRVNNIEWNTSFPFEKKYYGVPSSGLVRGVAPPTIIGPGPIIYDFKTKYVINNSQPDIFNAATYQATAQSYQLIFAETATAGNFKLINYNLNALCFQGSRIPLFFFGSMYGDTHSTNSFIFGINPKSGNVINDGVFGPNINPGHIGANNDYITGSSIGYSAEGWKYGLYNGLPTNFSAVFRQNHYGQFRDMLEQRIYTATYNNPEIGGPMDANGGIKFISGSSLAGESNNFLTASIYAADNVAEAYRVNPYGSGIFDALYRASQPWHADDTRVTIRRGL